MRLFHISAIATLALQVTAAIIGGSQHPFKLIEHPDAATRELLQNIVRPPVNHPYWETRADPTSGKMG
jgi:hypothetical protein